MKSVFLPLLSRPARTWSPTEGTKFPTRPQSVQDQLLKAAETKRERRRLRNGGKPSKKTPKLLQS